MCVQTGGEVLIGTTQRCERTYFSLGGAVFILINQLLWRLPTQYSNPSVYEQSV
jgi:hypothetical protein